jgi:RNA polymerase sigma-B factor
VVLEYLSVADAVANRYRARAQDQTDVRQVAYVGLVKAVQRFDPARGGDIVAFAVPTIAGEIKRYFRDASWMVRPPRALQELDLELRPAVSALSQRIGRDPSIDEIAEETGIAPHRVAEGLRCVQARQPVSLDAPARMTGDGEGATLGEILRAPEDDFSRADRMVAISRACGALSPRDRKILRMRFVQDCTQDEIARECQVTQMQISRLLTRILRELRSRLSPELLAA